MQPRGTIAQLRPGRRMHSPLETVVREHLDRLLHSAHFDASARSREFLCFVVEQALAGHGKQLNQTAIAICVFNRQADFDAILDPIVRVQAGRLRRSLERYYLLASDTGSIRIELPKGSYAPRFVATGTTGSEPEVVSTVLTDAGPQWPSVVIHLSATKSPEDDAVAARIEDELTSEICRYGDVHVVRQRDLGNLSPQRQARVRFQLRGSLWRDGDDHLIGAHLIDRTTGEQIWSDEYHTARRAGRWSGNVDEVARAIAARVGSEQGVVARLLAAECATRSFMAADTHPIHLCYRFFFTREVSALVPTIQALEQYIQRRPESAVAWAYLARLYHINYAFELSALRTPIDKAIECAYQGLLLDPGSARVRCVLASSLLASNELQSARDELVQALRLNPDSLAYREVTGWLLALAGNWEQGIAVMREAMRLNPYCLPHVQHGLWAEHMRRGEIEQAYVAALEYRDPTFFWRPLMMASCLGHLGRLSDAQQSVDALLLAKPDFQQRGRALIGYYIKPEPLHECIVEGLRKAHLTLA